MRFLLYIVSSTSANNLSFHSIAISMVATVFVFAPTGIPEIVMGDQMVPKCVSTYAKSLIDALSSSQSAN